MFTSPSPHSPTNSYPVFTIQHPEKSKELDTLTESVRVKIPDIFSANISPQMGTLLGQLPAFESMISRDHRIFDLEIYQFLVSRGYEVSLWTNEEQWKYRDCVSQFIEVWKKLWAKIDNDVYVETEIVQWPKRWNKSYKFYQTFDEKSWKTCIEKLPKLYGSIARDLWKSQTGKISAKFPAYLGLYRERCDNLVIYCTDIHTLPKIQALVERWIQENQIPSRNRPFYRSSFWIDAPVNPGEDKTSFSDLCAKLSYDYAKKYDAAYLQKTGKKLTNKEFNILALGQACMMASSDPENIKAMTKR